MARDIVYIDQDDEITSVVAKVEACKSKVVAIVPPKHTPVLSSVVSMKLLKKASDTNKKSLVIITAEANIIALAGAAGLHVAKSLKSKPVMPASPLKESDANSVITSEELENSKSVKVPAATAEADEVVHLDNTEKKSKKSVITPFNKKLKVPNFGSFRLKLFLSIFLVLFLVFGSVYAFVMAPEAKITIKTEVSSVDAAVSLSLSTALKDFDPKVASLPATLVEVKKNDSEKMPATGKKDVGTKATGTLTLTNCIDDGEPKTVPAGTGFTKDGYTFVTDTATMLDPALYAGSNCKSATFGLSRSVSVTASQAGGVYNIPGGSYATPAIFSGSLGKINATGSDMGGGTSKIVTVISNEDIEAAKSKLTGKSQDAAINELTDQLQQQSLLPIRETLTNTAPTFTTSAAVDAEVADVTVSAVTSYTLLGIAPDNLQKIIEDAITAKITDSRQKILLNGLDKKSVQLTEKKSSGEQKINVSVIATVGPDVNTAGISEEAAGKTRGEIQTMLSQRAGIKDVTVTYSPFWVTSTPKKAAKIQIVVEQVNAGQ